MDQLLRSLINSITPGLVSLIVSLAIAGAAYLYQRLIQQLPASVGQQINTLAEIITQAIEQEYSNTYGIQSTQKKQAAMQDLRAICKELRLPFDETLASAAIEAEVYAMNVYESNRRAASLAYLASRRGTPPNSAS